MTRAELIEKLEAADGPSCSLDAEIFRHMGEPLPKEFVGLPIKLKWQGDGTAVVNVSEEFQVKFSPPAYTASLDAAVGLVELVLPGWDWQLNAQGFAIICKEGVDAMYAGEGYSENEYIGSAKTLALALCIALLKALGGGTL